MINLLFSGPSSACLELVNDKPYYAPASYTLRLNGEPKGEGSANVFSLFGLTPNTTYMLVVVPYNSNDEVGTITRKQFTTLNNNGIEDVGEEEYAISSQGGRLTVSGAEGNMVNVYSLDGRCIYSASAKGTTVIDIPASGTYLVKIGHHTAREVVVIR